MTDWKLATLGFGALSLSGCTEALYMTKAPTAQVDKVKGYVFIGPYVTAARTDIIVAISKGAGSSGGTSNSSSAPDGKVHIKKDETIAISGGTTTTTTDTETKTTSADKKGAPTASVISLSAVAVPVKRSYLYFKKAAFFDNSVNLTAGPDGLLTSSDTASSQQISSIIGEIGQTAVGMLLVGIAPTPHSDLEACTTALSKLVANGPFYQTVTLSGEGSDVDAPNLQSATLRLVYSRALPGMTDPTEPNGQGGVVAFFPVLVEVQLQCTPTGGHPVPMTAPMSVYAYEDRHILRPTRDFLTNPRDTYSFSEGFLVGHKYADQSSAKTVVDTITAPLRSIFPAISVSTSTQIQTGGGKPDQTTTTTTQTSSPPK